ncbi:hypothetical protein [Hoylesella enoeca]|uniref:hypothetical protein n=1 Tax=Hoylesella enoeca TaxID=76123 RepID=UPI000A47FBC3|nr:hypothetical protein [Hoylesella enoeca]
MRKQTLIVPETKIFKLVLTDGTEVWLNADVKNTLQTLTESSNVGIELKDQTLYIY